MSLAHFPLNPDYGSGRYQRRLRFHCTRHAVLAMLDDTHHAMWLAIRHDGATIAEVSAMVARGPATTCGEAAQGLSALIGMPLSSDRRAIAAALTPTENCTHLADLTVWALRAWASGSAQFDICVADDAGEPYALSVSRDGALVHDWIAEGHSVVWPPPLAGTPLMRGFAKRARAHFEGDALEAAIMLQRGVFVARGRRHQVDLAPPLSLRQAEGMADSCYSHAAERLDRAMNHVGYVRDFTAGVTPEALPPYFAQFLQDAPE